MRIRLILCAATVFALACFYARPSAGEAAANPQVIVARIGAIRDGSIIVTVPRNPGDKPGGTFPVKTNGATTVTINGEKKGLTDLAVGQQAKITLADDGETAASIVIGEKAEAPPTK